MSKIVDGKVVYEPRKDFPPPPEGGHIDPLDEALHCLRGRPELPSFDPTTEGGGENG